MGTPCSTRRGQDYQQQAHQATSWSEQSCTSKADDSLEHHFTTASVLLHTTLDAPPAWDCQSAMNALSDMTDNLEQMSDLGYPSCPYLAGRPNSQPNNFRFQGER